MSTQEPQPIEAWLEALPDAAGLLFWPPAGALYTAGALYRGFDPARPGSRREAWDARVYRWTMGADGKPRELTPVEMVATRLHDAAMDRLVRDFIDPEHAVTVGFMGGHDIDRTEFAYAEVAGIARDLRRRGFQIVTGGGPGLMEAANFGAFMAPYTDDDLATALGALRTAPSYGASGDPAADEMAKQAWLCAAAKARADLLGAWDAPPKPGGESLGIPTWYYGSEPPNLFASVCGKYFMNSLREDGLVSLANGGLVFGKGAGGAVQEVFQNASYNYYRTSDVDATPMVFLGVDFWDPGPASDAAAPAPLDPKRKPVFPLVRQLAAECVHPFTARLLLTDDPAEITAFIVAQNAGRARRRADQRLSRVAAIPHRRPALS